MCLVHRGLTTEFYPQNPGEDRKDLNQGPFALGTSVSFWGPLQVPGCEGLGTRPLSWLDSLAERVYISQSS